MANASEFARIRREREEAALPSCGSHPRSKIEKERESMGMDTGDEGCLICGEVWWRGSRGEVSIDRDR